jgi:hypothetical protein
LTGPHDKPTRGGPTRDRPIHDGPTPDETHASPMGQLIPLHRDLPPNLRQGPLPARVVVPQAARIRPPFAASERHAPPFNYVRTATQAPSVDRAPNAGPPPRAGLANHTDRASYAERAPYDGSRRTTGYASAGLPPSAGTSAPAGLAPSARLAPPADPFGTDEVRLFPDLDATGELDVTENLAISAADEVTDSLELPVQPATGDDHAASDASAEPNPTGDAVLADSPSSPAPPSPPADDSSSVYPGPALTATFAAGEPESRRLLPGITSHAGRAGSGWRIGRRSRTRALRNAENEATRNNGAARDNEPVVGETHQAAGA